MSSILTNMSAMAALQTLRTIGQDMDSTQNRVSSGLRVATAADNAAYWSIATTMRSDNMALSAVQDALGLGAAKVDTAYSGMESTIEVVKEIKTKLVAAREPGVDKAKIQKEITQLQEQLVSIADSASFSGENWLKAKISDGANAALVAGTDDDDINALKKQIVGSFTRSGSSVTVQTINIDLDETNVLFDTGSTSDDGMAWGILDKGLVGADGTTFHAKTSVATLDITNLAALKDDTTGIVLAAATDDEALDVLIQHVDTQLEALNSAAAGLGSISTRISLQENFVSKLSDALDRGIGRLVDADMNEESTRLKALQTQQQLAIQSLSIANNNSQNILSLFR